MKSVRQIQQWAAQDLHELETDTALTTLLINWINEAAQDIAAAENWTWLEGIREFTYGTHGAGANTTQGVTYLPHYVHRLVSVWPSGRSYREQVRIIGGWELDALDPSMISGHPADYLALWGYYGVARDNPTAGVITIADAGGAAFQVTVEGIDTNGFDATETVTLVAGAGVTTTQFAAGPNGVRRCFIVENTTTAGTPGVVTFTSGGTQIERLNYANSFETSHEHLRTELSPAPNATGQNYVTRFQRRIRPVRTTADMVDVPFEFEGVLNHGIKRRMADFRKDFNRALAYEQMFNNGIRELRKWQNRQPGRMRGLSPLNPQRRRWHY